MKTKQTLLGVFFAILLMGNPSIAQDKKPAFVTVTTLHWNMDMKDYNEKDWLAIEKEYLDKVVRKNELIMRQRVLTHYFTADNSELLLVTAYANWEDIEKAGERTDALVKQAWPDEKARNAYFDKKEAYYQLKHSDEIYRVVDGAKLVVPTDKPMLYYVRKSHFATPKDGSEKELVELHKQYVEAVTKKNDLIKGYYPYVHAWGADKTEFTEVFVLESLCDVEKSFDRNQELFKAAWGDEAKRKEFGKKMGKYFTGIHGDYIYRSVPELTKQ